MNAYPSKKLRKLDIKRERGHSLKKNGLKEKGKRRSEKIRMPLVFKQKLLAMIHPNVPLL